MWTGPKLLNLQTCDLGQINLGPVLTSEKSDITYSYTLAKRIKLEVKTSSSSDQTAFCAFKCLGDGVGELEGVRE